MSEYDPMGTELGGDYLNSEKRKRGRPPGVKNRPKETLVTEEKLKQLYDRFSPFLTEDQKQYVQGVIDGKENVDCAREMELLVRQMGLLFQEAATWFFTNGKINGDLAKFADSLRMGIKDLSDLRDKEEERATRKIENDGLVQLTERGTAMERIASLIGGDSSE